MNRASRSAALLCGGCLFFAATLAHSQPAPGAGEDRAAGAQPEIASEADRVIAAIGAWLEALVDKPALVSLGTPPDLSGAGDVLADLLEERLLVLGKKFFSNREWSAYWERQQKLATDLAALLDADPQPRWHLAHHSERRDHQRRQPDPRLEPRRLPRRCRVRQRH